MTNPKDELYRDSMEYTRTINEFNHQLKSALFLPPAERAKAISEIMEARREYVANRQPGNQSDGVGQSLTGTEGVDDSETGPADSGQGSDGNGNPPG